LTGSLAARCDVGFAQLPDAACLKGISWSISLTPKKNNVDEVMPIQATVSHVDTTLTVWMTVVLTLRWQMSN
jgi:hypothetical protein